MHLPVTTETVSVFPDNAWCSPGSTVKVRRRHFRQNDDKMLEGTVTEASGRTITVTVSPYGPGTKVWREELVWLTFVAGDDGEFAPLDYNGSTWKVFAPDSDYARDFRAFLDARDRYHEAQQRFGEAAAIVRTARWDEIEASAVASVSAGDNARADYIWYGAAGGTALGVLSGMAFSASGGSAIWLIALGVILALASADFRLIRRHADALPGRLYADVLTLQFFLTAGMWAFIGLSTWGIASI